MNARNYACEASTSKHMFVCNYGITEITNKFSKCNANCDYKPSHAEEIHFKLSLSWEISYSLALGQRGGLKPSSGT